MYYVYILESISSPGHFYTGRTINIHRRLQEHNRHKHEYTSRHKPWKLTTYVAFGSEEQAVKFEKYLKTPSGRAFAKKRL